jgi:hypothetical protein
MKIIYSSELLVATKESRLHGIISRRKLQIYPEDGGNTLIPKYHNGIHSAKTERSKILVDSILKMEAVFLQNVVTTVTVQDA